MPKPQLDKQELDALIKGKGKDDEPDAPPDRVKGLGFS